MKKYLRVKIEQNESENGKSNCKYKRLLKTVVFHDSGSIVKSSISVIEFTV